MLQTHEKRMGKCFKASTIPAHSQTTQQHTGAWNPHSTAQWPPNSSCQFLGQVSHTWASLPLQPSSVSDSLLSKICVFPSSLWIPYMPKVQSNCVTRVFALCLSQHLLQLLPSVIPMCWSKLINPGVKSQGCLQSNCSSRMENSARSGSGVSVSCWHYLVILW